MSETLLQKLDKAIAWHDKQGTKDIAIRVNELRECADRIRDLERAQHAGEAREPVCRTCNGRGTVNRWERVGESDFDEWEDDCPVCGGAGNAPEHVQKLHDQLIATRQDLHNVQMRIATADLKALIAAPQPAALPEGWQPIETAPRDREIWAFNGEQARMQWSEGDGWALWIWCDALLSDADPSPDQPTHWMPLPAAPAAHT